MKKLIVLTLIAVMCACGGISAPVAASDSSSGSDTSAESAVIDQSNFVKLNLDYATIMPATSPAQGVIDRIQELCDELMPGLVKITTYDNGTLLNAADIHEGVANGTAQMGVIQPDLQPTRYPVSMLFEYPGIAFNSAESASRAWSEFIRTNDIPEYSDVKILFGYGTGPGAIFSQKEYTDIKDFSGQQIRAVGIAAPEIAAWGATPSSMEFSEVYEALRSGLVDGCFTNFAAGAVMKFQEICKSCLITPMYNSVYAYVMNIDTWESMPPEQQELFMQAVDEACETHAFTFGDAGYRDLPVNRDCFNAINVVWHEGEFLQQCIDACAPMLNEYASTLENGPELVEKVQALADKYNASCTWDDFKAYFLD